MSLEDEARRGKEAEQLLRNPLIAEAFNALDAWLRTERERCDIRQKDYLADLIRYEQLLGRLQDHFRSLIMSGESAKLQLKEREALGSRVVNAYKHGVRNFF